DGASPTVRSSTTSSQLEPPTSCGGGFTVRSITAAGALLLRRTVCPRPHRFTGIFRRLDAMLFRIPFKSAIICGVLILLGPSVFSQARIGSIQGTVKDPGGALVPNATITVTQPVTGYKQTT